MKTNGLFNTLKLYILSVVTHHNLVRKFYEPKLLIFSIQIKQVQLNINMEMENQLILNKCLKPILTSNLETIILRLIVHLIVLSFPF